MKKYLAKRNLFLYCVLILAIASITFMSIILLGKTKELAAILIISIFLIWTLSLPWVYKTIAFEIEGIVYKKNLFSKKYLIEYECLKKIYIDYTGYTVSYYKGALPRIVLFFDNDSKIETDIRYEFLRYLIENKPKRCSIKIATSSYKICPEKQRELLKDYLTQKQKNEIERLIAEKEAKRRKRTGK